MTSQLQQDVAEPCAVAGRHSARHQRICGIMWPNGARMAVNCTADFDAMLHRRLIELFDSHDIKATIFTPAVSVICIHVQ
jgi:hypothetical protein